MIGKMNYELLKKLSVFDEIGINEVSCLDPFTKAVSYYMLEDFGTRMFIIKDSFYGLLLNPPPYLEVNKSTNIIRESFLWFTFFKKNGLITIAGKTNLYEMLDLIDGDALTEIVFNLDLFV